MNYYNTIPEAISALKNGEIIIVTDNEDRENEGDFICAAEFATAEKINFMSTYGKGLICMPMSVEKAHSLDLQQMVSNNTDRHATAFTVSIDCFDSTTGISAEERSRTVQLAASSESKPSDFRRPGHIFPLVAKPHGVLERNGHTEATVDLMRLAGLQECGVCCEIIKSDGTMMRTPDLMVFAKEWQMKIITVQALQLYRKCHDTLVKCVASPQVMTKYGEFRIYGFESTFNQEHHLALVKGEISDFEGHDILCRLHSECLTGEVFHSSKCDCGTQLEMALNQIASEERGILLYLRQEGRGIGLLNKLRAYELQNQGLDTVEANLKLGFDEDLRDYGMGAQMLKALGINRIKLMTNNPDKVSQLESVGIHIVERVPIEIQAHEYDYAYLQTKQIKMGHFINVI